MGLELELLKERIRTKSLLSPHAPLSEEEQKNYEYYWKVQCRQVQYSFQFHQQEIYRFIQEIEADLKRSGMTTRWGRFKRWLFNL